MLFWQRKSTHKRIILWAKLATLSTIVHVTLFVWFFFIFKDPSSRLSFVVTPDLFNREILFTIAPPVKKVPAKATAVSIKKSPTKKTGAVPKAAAKKQTTIASGAKKTVDKKVAVVKKEQPKKPVAKKIESVKKTEPVKQVPAQKKDVAKPLENPQKSIDQTKSEGEVPTSHHELAVHKLGMHEKGLLQEFQALHEEIVAKWAPPPGTAADCTCQVTILVDWKGAIKTVQLNESSGVLMYDMAAQQVLAQIEMPKWTWGKEITITFN